MPTHIRRLLVATAGALVAALALSACTAADATAPTSSAGAAAGTITVTDNFGEQAIPAAPASIVVTDNRSFELLERWGVPIAAAPQRLVPEGVGYKTDEAVVDLGNHREPNLEALVAVAPDLVINGQRFASHRDAIRGLVPDAAMLELDPREGEPFDAELIRHALALGEALGKQDEAQQAVDDFTAAIERVKAAYDGDDRVMAVITSGGEINYAAPVTGRTLGPLFDMLGFVPAIGTSGSSDHEGDDISVEAIAAANPDWILVLDRDAAIGASKEADYRPAHELLAASAALQGVTAVQHDRILYMPQDTYLNESILTYTEYLESIADAMEAAK